MSWLGKEYVYESSEGISDFLGAFGKSVPEELKEFKVKVKTIKEGDTYTVTHTRPNGEKKFVYKPGVEFDDEFSGKPCKTTVTVDGNTVISKRKLEKIVFVLKSDYDGDKMITTLSVEGLDMDITATITFKAA